MPTSLDEILERIGVDKQLTLNQAPPPLIHGGMHDHINLKPQRKINRQIVLVASEFRSREAEERSTKARDQIQSELGILMKPFFYADREGLESVLDDFSTHFQMTLDKDKIIRSLTDARTETVFYLYAGVFEQPFYG